jgi:hypothetical protein
MAASAYRTRIVPVYDLEEDDVEFITRTLTPTEVESMTVSVIPKLIVAGRPGKILIPVVLTAEMAFVGTPGVGEWSGLATFAAAHEGFYSRAFGEIDQSVFTASEDAAFLTDASVPYGGGSVTFQGVVGKGLEIFDKTYAGSFHGGVSPIRFGLLFKEVPAEAW